MLIIQKKILPKTERLDKPGFAGSIPRSPYENLVVRKVKLNDLLWNNVLVVEQLNLLLSHRVPVQHKPKQGTKLSIQCAKYSRKQT